MVLPLVKGVPPYQWKEGTSKLAMDCPRVIRDPVDFGAHPDEG